LEAAFVTVKEMKPAMDSRSRFALAVTVTLVGAAALVLALATSPEVLPRESPRPPRTAIPRSTALDPAQAASASAPAPLPVEGASAAREVPLPPEATGAALSSMSSEENDPIPPELPQTPEWRHGKLVRITGLLERDVTRLEQERELARTRGDAAEARRLDVQIVRHRARLESLRAESASVAASATVAEAAAP
jgi:hypothetical protein